MSLSRKHKSNIKLLESGYTMIELLVVITIIGILAATAIPAYTRYRSQAFDSIALSELRMIATAEESYFIENQDYFSCSNADCANYAGINEINKDINVEATASGNTFVVTSEHKKGTGKKYTWNSESSSLINP